MKLLYLSTTYSPHDFRFLQALSETAYEVYFLQLVQRKNKLEQRPLPAGINRVDWKFEQEKIRWRDFPALQSELRQVIKTIRPDLIHAGPVHSAAFLVALTSFRPLLTLSWGWDILSAARKSPWLRWATLYTLKHTDILAADCQAVLENAASLGFPLERMVKFPWGVDLEQFSPSGVSNLRKELHWRDNFVLLSLRSWEQIYGVDVVLNGFSIALKEEPSLRLLLLGDGSEAAKIQGLIKEYNLAEKVHLAGRIGQEALPAYYHASDIYLSASHCDGSSVSLLEALACGLPVLVSDIPGNREWIGDGKAGWMFPDGDAQALGELILQCFGNQKELRTKRLNARALAEQRANWKKNFSILLDGYQKALTIRGGV